MDIFMLGFHCLQAKFENDNKALDVKGGMERCAKIGIYPGCPPLGYLPDKGGIKGARKRDVDPVNFPLVRKMWDLMLAGTHTPNQILMKATDEWGLRTRNGNRLAKSMIYKIFHNPFYYGEFEFPVGSGAWYKGIHKTMITKAEFDQVQMLIRKPNNPRPIHHYFAFGGCSLHCSECGCAVTGMAKTKRQKNGNVHHYMYYGCTKRRGSCTQMPVTEKALSENILQILSDIHIPAVLHSLVMEWVRRENDTQFKGIRAQQDANKKAHDTLQKKMAGLIDMRASDLITDNEFQERREQIMIETGELLRLVNTAEKNINGWLNTAERLFSFTEISIEHFKSGIPEIQRGILRDLGWNLSIKEKQLDLTRENWIEPVMQISKRIKKVFPPSEPVLSPYYKDEIENLLNSKIMCSLLQDVRNLLAKNLSMTLLGTQHDSTTLGALF